MSRHSMSNPNKALVAKYWCAAILTDRGFKVDISKTENRLKVTKGQRTLTVRTKACYSKLGVPFYGFQIGDSDFVVLVDLRRTALNARAWIVPTEILYTELEQAYKAMDRDHLSNRTFYWEDGTKPH